jgi:hypothetical protein
VVVAGFGEVGELGGDGGAFLFEFGEPGDDAGAHGGDGGGVGVEAGEGFDFAGVGVLGGVDLADAAVQRGRGGAVLGGVASGGGGDLGGEQGGAVGAEDPLCEELAEQFGGVSSRMLTVRGCRGGRCSSTWWRG